MRFQQATTYDAEPEAVFAMLVDNITRRLGVEATLGNAWLEGER